MYHKILEAGSRSRTTRFRTVYCAPKVGPPPEVPATGSMRPEGEASPVAGGYFVSWHGDLARVFGAEDPHKIKAARSTLLPPEGRPASTTLPVAGLAGPDLLVQVEAVAVLDD